MKFLSKSIEDTNEIAKDFLEKVSKGIYEGALIIGLYGDLGSGKTTFTQFFAKHLDVKERITSPTFVLEKIYPIKFGDFENLIHIDAYRFDNSKELLALSWREMANNPKNIILIEWPEKVLDVLPENHAKIYFTFVSENERQIEI